MARNLFDIESRLGKCRKNSCIVDALFESGLLDVERIEFLYTTPPKIETVYLNKVEGILFGTAIGDALGVKFESRPPEYILNKYGHIKGFHQKAHITDDTQLTFWTLEVFLNQGWLDPKKLADRYTKERITGIGKTMKAFIKNYKDLRVPWYLAGVNSAGNGALMRLSPLVIPHLLNPSKELWCDAIVTTYLIYHDRLAIASAVAFVSLLWECFRIQRPLEADWWIEKYVAVARELEGDNTTYSTRYGTLKYKGPAWYFIEKVLEDASKEKWSLKELSSRIGSGAYLLETIPVVLYTLMMHADTPYTALTEAITYSKDSDTIGAIVGYFIGAIHGSKAFPRYLVEPMLNGKILPRKYVSLIASTLSYLKKTSEESEIDIDYSDMILTLSK
ncbi:ADP-ribosylglycohydrolase family protein [Geoglobus acetivorans]|uniref:Putative ADP-ribosylglycohydrolase n=1 Tax=Geoglobus acetivorans TaxID=565033 RepID=A0A0A7GAS7_GEOAI|nr:putative ADP-ribosylglycohydrolase [Geoglobus acetivorans]